VEPGIVTRRISCDRAPVEASVSAGARWSTRPHNPVQDREAHGCHQIPGQHHLLATSIRAQRGGNVIELIAGMRSRPASQRASMIS
jgi:hypothetical protein